MKRDAVISADQLYRYRLYRGMEREGPTAGVIMVNPSTADATVDDATIRKLIGFSHRLGYRDLIVGNKFAFRATDVAELKTAADPIGPHNNEWLMKLMLHADILIAAWGPLGKLPRHLRTRWKAIAGLAGAAGKPLYCWGVAQDGHPRHPLMLAYDTPLVRWAPLE